MFHALFLFLLPPEANKGFLWPVSWLLEAPYISFPFLVDFDVCIIDTQWRGPCRIQTCFPVSHAETCTAKRTFVSLTLVHLITKCKSSFDFVEQLFFDNSWFIVVAQKGKVMVFAVKEYDQILHMYTTRIDVSKNLWSMLMMFHQLGSVLYGRWTYIQHSHRSCPRY